MLQDMKVHIDSFLHVTRLNGDMILRYTKDDMKDKFLKTQRQHDMKVHIEQVCVCDAQKGKDKSGVLNVL